MRAGRAHWSAVTVPAPERIELLGAVAYGELAAFTRLAADAQQAPDLGGRTELAALAAVEMEHFERIRAHLAGRDVDVVESMRPFAEPFDAFHLTVAPKDWPEALLTAHLGRGLATDVLTEIGERLEGVEGELVRDVLVDSGYGAFVEREVRAACADRLVRDRLALHGRRLLGEALAAANAVLDGHPYVAAVVVDDQGGRAAMFKRVKLAHNRRLGALGL